MARKTVADVLWALLIRLWREQGWRVIFHPAPRRHRPQIIGEFDLKRRVVHLYPHPSYQPISKTGLHEMIHIRLALSGEMGDERDTHWLEEYLWKRLRPDQRQLLDSIFTMPAPRMHAARTPQLLPRAAKGRR